MCQIFKLCFRKSISLFLALFLCSFLFSQTIKHSDIKQSEKKTFRISSVEYNIQGLTIEALLRKAIPVDTKTVFVSENNFLDYLKKLKASFENIRTLESTNIEPIYKTTDSNGLTQVHLIIHTKDSINFIIIPYPKYDSNSGFLLRLKAQDNNFLGTMLPFNFGMEYTQGNSKSLIFDTNFRYPYAVGPFFASQDFNADVKIGLTDKNDRRFNFKTTSAFSYSYKFLTVNFGLTQGFQVNKNRGAKIGNKGYKYVFNTKPFLSMPMNITKVGNFGSLVYIPSFAINTDWTFSKKVNSTLKTVTLEAGHSLGFGNIIWKNNFREGLNFSVSNNYKYNLIKKAKPNISFGGNFSGYITFFDAFAVYGKIDFFYNLYNHLSDKAGSNLRGILNRRINTDLAVTFNLDIPIKVLDLNFEEITGKSWTRFFSFELQISPFLDIALVHDIKTNRYFSAKDIWCSGGFEIIVFPKKFRSMYLRASIGFDLLELKNLPKITNTNVNSKRDGLPITEIFIGLGLHY